MTGRLRSFRERLAALTEEAPLRDVEKNSAEDVATNSKFPQTADLLRVEFVATEATNRKQTPPPVGQRCFVAGCSGVLVDIAYCAEHRRMADDGSLWLRCVFCQASVAPNDLIACAEHRAELDRVTMPWEGER